MNFFKKVDSLLKKAGDFVLQTVVGAPARQLISFGLDAAKGVAEAAGVKTEPGGYVPKGVAKLFLGEEEVLPKSEQVKKAVTEGVDVLGKKVSGAAGLGLVAAGTLLDVVPVAGSAEKQVAKGTAKAIEKGLIKKVVKEVSEEVPQLTKSVKVAEEIVDTAVPYERKVRDFLDQSVLKSTRGLLQDENRFGKVGKEIAERFDLMREESVLNKAHDIIQLSRAVKILKKDELENFTAVAEGMAEPVSRNVSEAVSVWNDIRKKIADQAEKLELTIQKSDGTKIPFTPRENFFPHIIPDETLKDLIKNSLGRSRLFDEMVKSGQAVNTADAQQKFRRFIQDRTTKKYGHLEKAREVDFPIYERDPRKVLFEYIGFAHDRLAQAKYFGADDIFAKKAFEEMREAGKDFEMAQRVFNRVVGNEIVDPLLKKVSAYARTYEIVTKLGLGAITNLGQLVNTATRTGLMPALKAQLQAIVKRSDSLAFSERAGNISQVLDEQLRLSGADTAVATKFLRWVQFQKVELNNRTVASLAGKNYAELLFNNLKLTPESTQQSSFAYRRLKALGVDLDEALKQGKLSDKDKLKAAYTVVKDTQFSANPEDLPFYWSHPLGKTATQFKSFAFNQAVFIKKFILDELKHGNVKPLIIYAVVGEGMGEVIGDLRAKVRKRERPEGFERVVDNLLTVGGIGLVSDFYQNLRFGSLTGGSQLFGFFFGPAMSDLVQIMQSTYSATAEAKPKELVKKALSSIPVVGPYATQSIFPSSQKYRARGGFIPGPLQELLEKKSVDKKSLPGISNKKKLPGTKPSSKLPGR